MYKLHNSCCVYCGKRTDTPNHKRSRRKVPSILKPYFKNIDLNYFTWICCTCRRNLEKAIKAKTSLNDIVSKLNQFILKLDIADSYFGKLKAISFPIRLGITKKYCY